MNPERQQAYLNLINQLLNSPSGEEAEILKTHPELLDDGLVAATKPTDKSPEMPKICGKIEQIMSVHNLTATN